MKKKTVLDYIAKPKEPTALFQVHMSQSILAAMQEGHKKLGISWRDLMDAMFQKFLDDRKHAK